MKHVSALVNDHRHHACRFGLRLVAATVTATLGLCAIARGEDAKPAKMLPGLDAAKEAAAPAFAGTPVSTATPTTAAKVTVAVQDDVETAKAKAAHNEVRGLLNLGKSLTDRAEPDFEAAEIAFRQALNSPAAQAEDIKTGLLGMGHMHRKHGELTKAAAIYERYLSDYPGDERSPDALLELGRTLRDMGAFKLAIARFYSVINSTLKVQGNDFDRYQILAKTAQFEIAETHFAAGEYDEANKYYTKFRLLDVAPADRARAHFKAADALRRQGNLEGAVTAFRAFIEQWPEDENVPEARYLLTVTLRDLKRPNEAMAVVLELLKAEKERPNSEPKRLLHWQLVTGNQLANEYFESGDIVSAHTIYSSLLELSPDLSWRLPITYQLGLCYERLGIMDRARSSYKSVVDLAGAKPASQFAELAQMAAWRIDHLDWSNKVSRDINSFFDSTTGKQAGMTDRPKASATP
jgi:tetratricopeptide (TPR) repeat protein